MKIERETLGNVGVLTIHGKMLIGEGDEMLREEIEIFLKEGATRILLDFKAMPYVDSAALGELIRSYTTMARKDGTVALLNPDKRIIGLFRSLQLNTIFPKFDSKEQALRALKDSTWNEYRDWTE